MSLHECLCCSLHGCYALYCVHLSSGWHRHSNCDGLHGGCCRDHEPRSWWWWDTVRELLCLCVFPSQLGLGQQESVRKRQVLHNVAGSGGEACAPSSTFTRPCIILFREPLWRLERDPLVGTRCILERRRSVRQRSSWPAYRSSSWIDTLQTLLNHSWMRSQWWLISQIRRSHLKFYQVRNY